MAKTGKKAKTRDHAKTQENLINQLLEKNENTWKEGQTDGHGFIGPLCCEILTKILITCVHSFP